MEAGVSFECQTLNHPVLCNWNLRNSVKNRTLKKMILLYWQIPRLGGRLQAGFDREKKLQMLVLVPLVIVVGTWLEVQTVLRGSLCWQLRWREQGSLLLQITNVWKSTRRWGECGEDSAQSERRWRNKKEIKHSSNQISHD